MLVSKTDFLIYRNCAHNAWLKIHKPEVYGATPASAFEQNTMETGNEVDALARDLFPGGVPVARGDAEKTAALVKKRTPILYQPVFETDRYTTACDILVWNAAASVYDLYEVKASTKSADQRYTYDIAFQAGVLRENHLPLGRLFLVHLDKSYEFHETLDVQSLFTVDVISERVNSIFGSVTEEMAKAYETLQSDHEPPPPCCCLRKGRGRHCTTFAHTNPTVPDYSIHDITRISQKKLAQLVDRNIMAIEDVPDDFELNDAQKNQVHVAKAKIEMVDTAAIQKFIAGVQYPIAFLDYETYPCATPRFAGYHPFDQIPFQFSLHVIQRPGSEPTHNEFLFSQSRCTNNAHTIFSTTIPVVINPAASARSVTM
jgi:hypothetical protein